MRLSVVIPAFNEERGIGAAVRAVRTIAAEWEVVVADGESTDRTCAEAREASADLVVRVPRGRGRQLNAGARAASGEALLFLHADARLPREAPALVQAVLADPGLAAGAFRLCHERSGGGSLARRFLWIADLRSRYTRLPYGDQAVFVSRANFELAGGYPEQPLMEDLELAKRLRRIGPIRTVGAEVSVSARRFEQQPLKSFLCWMTFPSLYRAGVGPERLARWYGAPREVAS